MSRDGFVRIKGDRINGLFHLLINGVYFGVTSYNPLTNLLLTFWAIQVVRHPLHGWHLSSCLGGTCENFTQKTFSDILNAKEVKQADLFNYAKHPPKTKHIGWWGDLFGRYESFMFSGKQIVNISSNRKKASFQSTSRICHWTFTKKKLENGYIWKQFYLQ